MQQKRATYVAELTEAGLSHTAAVELIAFFHDDPARAPNADATFNFEREHGDYSDAGLSLLTRYFRAPRLRGLTELARDSEAASSNFNAHVRASERAASGDGNARLATAKAAANGQMFTDWILDLDARDAAGTVVLAPERRAITEIREEGASRLAAAAQEFTRRLAAMRKRADKLEADATALRRVAGALGSDTFSADPRGGGRSGPRRPVGRG